MSVIKVIFQKESGSRFVGLCIDFCTIPATAEADGELISSDRSH